MILWNNHYSNIVLAAIIGLLFVPVPTDNLWWREFLNSGHTILFIILSFFIYHQIKSKTRISNVLIIYIFLLVAGVLLGIAIESLQALVQREASLNDLYRNFYGIMTGICLLAAFNIKSIYYPIKLTLGLTAAVFFYLAWRR